MMKWGIFGLVALPSVVLGNGFRLVSQDAFAAARGEAFVATADNPSAIHYNPAGLTQLDGQQLRLGSYNLYFDPTFQPPAGAANAGTTYDIKRKYAVAPQLYFTHALENRPVTFGVGVYAPYGASVTWPEDTGFRAVAIEGELTYLRFNPVVAVELLPGLSVAGGIMIDYGDIALAQGTMDLENDVLPNQFRFEGDTISVGFNLGILWEVDEKITLGATLRSGTGMNFKGKTTVEESPVIPSTDVPASADFDFPLTAVIGISYRPTKDWNIEFNADFTDWSSLGTVPIKHSEPSKFPVQQNEPLRLQWEDSWIFKLGATRYFGEGWRASAGYVFNQNSVPNAYYSPLLADLDRHIFSVGVGREQDDFSWDVTYQLGIGEDHKVEGSAPGSTPGFIASQDADGIYDFVSHALLVSAGWRF